MGRGGASFAVSEFEEIEPMGEESEEPKGAYWGSLCGRLPILGRGGSPATVREFEEIESMEESEAPKVA